MNADRLLLITTKAIRPRISTNMRYRLNSLFIFLGIISVCLSVNAISPWYGYLILIGLATALQFFVPLIIWRNVMATSILGGICLSVIFHLILWGAFASQRVETSHRYGPIWSSKEKLIREHCESHIFPVGFIFGGMLGLKFWGTKRQNTPPSP